MTYRQVENIFKKHYEHGLMDAFSLSDCKIDIIEEVVRLSKKQKPKTKILKGKYAKTIY